MIRSVSPAGSTTTIITELIDSVVQEDAHLNDVLMAAADQEGNVGGFIVREGGAIETPAVTISNDGEIETARLYAVDDGDGSFLVTDPLGNVGFAVSASGETRTSTSADSGEVDVSPIVATDFFLIEGKPLPFYAGNVLSERYDPVPAIMAISSGSLAVEGSGQIVIDPDLCDATGRLTVRPTDSSGLRKILDINMNIAPAGSAETVSYLLIGDSITKGNVALGTYLSDLVADVLTDAGYTPDAQGTITPSGGGELNEGRASRDMDDYVGVRLTNMLPIDGTGGNTDAAYIAGDAAYKAAHNPFVVAVTGPDDIWGTGWAIDFAQYRTRFSIPALDFIAIGLATNSLIGVTVEDGIASILAGMDHWREKIRDDLPDVLIAFWVPTVPRDPESDVRHAERRAPTLLAMIERIRSYADARCVLLNSHAQMSQEAGWALGDTTTDADTGVVTSTPSTSLDNIHPNLPAAKELARVLAAAAAYSVV